MGLDITAVSNLRRLDIAPGDVRRYALDSDCHCVFHDDNDGCPNRLDGRSPGWYARTQQSKVYSFAAGAYNTWREWLAKTMFCALPKVIWNEESRFAGQPFIELIAFSDCRGVIGPDTARKLARDFAEHDTRAVDAVNAHPHRLLGDGWFYRQYQSWQLAFETAADSGFVFFH